MALSLVFAATAVTASPVLAQDESSAAEQPVTETPPEDGTEEVTVTGSRIKRKSVATPAPVSVVDIQDILSVGQVSVADILQRLPANANAINIQVNNGGTGAARVDLRSLGTARTLVLVNGRRFVPGGNGVNASVDLNSIPLAVIERIEILKDGGSAIYGSDAIAGVVNVITKRDFEGVEATAFSSMTDRGDGRVMEFNFTGGVTSDDGRSNVVFGAQYVDIQPMFAGDREFSRLARSFNFNRYDAAGGSGPLDDFIDIGGSTGVPAGRILDRTGAPGNAAWDATGCGRGVDCQNGSEQAGDVGDGYRPLEDPRDQYNFQPENYLSTPNQRLAFWTSGNYRASDYLGFFFEGSLTNRSSEQLLAPTPLVTIGEGLTVSGDNIYNPFGRDFRDVRRRMLEAGNRRFSQDSNTFRLVLGLEGDLPAIGNFSGWSWDAYLTYGRTETTVEIQGRFNRLNLERAIGPADGCTGDCVPLNLFGGPGSITEEMVDYISFVGVDRGFNEQYIGAVNVGGPLFNLYAQDPVAISFGYEFRREEAADIPNPLAASGQATGNTRNATRGFFEVNGVFAELSAPIVSGVTGIQQLELTAALRYVDFNTFGNNTTYKLGLRWNPVNFLAFRGTFSTAFRAPSIGELFQGAADSFPRVGDICSTDPAIGAFGSDEVVATNCAAEGFANGISDSRNQLPTTIGGNQGLDAETAETITVGVVFEDNLIKGLTASFDFYRIEIDNAITSIGANVILSGCYGRETPIDSLCNLIVRDPGSGLITDVQNLETNVGGEMASGFDFEVRYNSPNLPFGRIGLGVEGTVILDLITTLATGFDQQRGGYFTAGEGSNPDYRLNAFARWAYGMFNAGTNFRYLPGTQECAGGVCSVDSATAPISRDVDDYLRMDLFAGFNVSSPLGSTSITVGINNLTDAEPPFVSGGLNANTDPLTYDLAGRTFYGRVSQRF